MFSLNSMFFCSLIEELCTKEEIYKTNCNFNFGQECILLIYFFHLFMHKKLIQMKNSFNYHS